MLALAAAIVTTSVATTNHDVLAVRMLIGRQSFEQLVDQPGKLPKQSARGLLRIQVVRWLVSFVLAIAVANLLGAAPLPLTLKDVSLMLRSGYSSEAVMREVEARKFADTLDP